MLRSATTVVTPSERADARNERRLESLRDERQGDRARDERRAEHRADRPSARDRFARDRPARDARAPVGDLGAPVRGEWAHVVEPPPERGLPGRRTVTITGLGAEGYATRHGTRASAAQRHQAIKRHERDGFRPDRVAMWAVMLGVMLMLAAAASSHAAVLAHHMLAH